MSIRVKPVESVIKNALQRRMFGQPALEPLRKRNPDHFKELLAKAQESLRTR